MKKALASNFSFSIGKVAKAVGVKEHTVRSWQKFFPHIKFIVGKGDRRYYDDKAIEQFKKIKHLMYIKGFKIAGIQKLIKYGTIKDKGALDDTADENIMFFMEYINNECPNNKENEIMVKNEPYHSINKDILFKIKKDIQSVISYLTRELELK